MKKTYIIILALIMTGFALSCGGDKSSSGAGPGTVTVIDPGSGFVSNLTPVSDVVGKDGGVITDDSGAELIIPPGALADDTKIYMLSYSGSGDFYTDFGHNAFVGAVQFGPQGQKFLKPVTVIFPLWDLGEDGVVYSNGDKIPMFVLNESTGVWEMLPNAAEVIMNGYYAMTTIDHFSSDAGLGMPSNLMSQIDYYLSLYPGNPSAAFQAYRNWVLNNTGILDQTKNEGGTCYQVDAVTIDFMTHQSGSSGTNEWEGHYNHGNYTNANYSPMEINKFSYDSDYMNNGTQMIFSLLLTIKWKKCEDDGVSYIHVNGETWNFVGYFRGSDWDSIYAKPSSDSWASISFEIPGSNLPAENNTDGSGSNYAKPCIVFYSGVSTYEGCPTDHDGSQSKGKSSTQATHNKKKPRYVTGSFGGSCAHTCPLHVGNDGAQMIDISGDFKVYY